MIKLQKKFKLVSNFKPTGDQPQAIEKLTKGIVEGRKHQTLLGATGTGKTFTMANIIANVQKPTLILAHNKTLAAQLASEFREFFPENAVRYFVSYYDYYQPEAYKPSTDTYIEKEAQINEEIEKYRNAATQSLLTRNDVIIVASVSCIYGLGSPETYDAIAFGIKRGQIFERNKLLRRFVDLLYTRNDLELKRSNFRAKGDIVEIFPSYEDNIIRISYFGDEIESIKVIDPLTGEIIDEPEEISIFPSNHYVTPFDILKEKIPIIRKELEERIKFFKSQNKLLEAERMKQRTNYDIEMLEEVGYCRGIENYSPIIEGRTPGEPPSTLLDYFPDDYMMFIDESHITLPQVRGMYHGDRSRKQTLVEYGFRLPSAMDNRPLNFYEFQKRINQVIYVSATPQEYELINSIESAQKLYPKAKITDILLAVTQNTNEEKKKSKLYNEIITKLNYEDYQITGIAQQIIRPTGLLDPKIEIRPIMGQIKDLETEIKIRKSRGERVLVTTLTKRMAEELTVYLKENGFSVQYLHSDVETIERVEILRDLRLGIFDVVVGINLLREGLDLPEVSLVAILDADKEGFLRNQTSLIQTIGRAARHPNGHVIMYADYITDSMKLAIEETERRRRIQEEYNHLHNITPKPIIKKIEVHLQRSKDKNNKKKNNKENTKNIDLPKNLTREQIEKLIEEYTRKMKEAADNLEFFTAAEYRDRIESMKKLYNQ